MPTGLRPAFACPAPAATPFAPPATRAAARGRRSRQPARRPRTSAAVLAPQCAAPLAMVVLDSRLLALTALVTAAYQAAFASVALACRFDKLTDFAGGTNFLVLAVLTFVVGAVGGSGSGPYARQVVLTALVVVWSLRLAGFLLYRILLWGEDRRFDGKRDNLAGVAVFWTLQALWVWTVSLPLTVLNSSPRNPPLGALDYVGWTLFAAGLALETVADLQKLYFKAKPANAGRWTDTGVWAWSRHPNYFGEQLLWCASFVSACRVFEGADWVAAAGPAFIVLLLLFVSGIPLLEASADKKHGTKPEYREYKRRTSVLLPIPPALYVCFPEAVKRTLLLDFPLYNPMNKGVPETGEALPPGAGAGADEGTPIVDR